VPRFVREVIGKRVGGGGKFDEGRLPNRRLNRGAHRNKMTQQAESLSGIKKDATVLSV